MPDFTVVARTPPRLDGDFQITATPPHTPTADETQYLTEVHDALDRLARDASADARARLRGSLRDARRNWRATRLALLRTDADAVAAGRETAAAARPRVATVMDDYARSLPDIVIADVTPQRFGGELSVTCKDFNPTTAERGYLDQLQRLLDYLTDDETSDGAARFSETVLAARRAQRKATADEIRKDAGYWKDGELESDIAINNVFVLKGAYQALRDRLTRSLFSVGVVTGEGAAQRFAVDLLITLEQGLPPPNDVASPDKQELFVQLNNASTVIGKVCQQIRDRAESPWRRRTGSVDEEGVKRAQHLLDEYLKKLAGIGRLGLEGPHTALAKLALASLKSEFVAREAGRIKNRYVRRLGFWAGGFALFLLVVYAYVASGCPTVTGGCSTWWTAHKTFLLAAIGAAVGTWVSFSVRRLDLPFEELGLSEEEALDPPFRVLFVVALTLAACLLFWTSAINIEIGNLKTGPDSFKTIGSIAVLIGLFCGLSERALATAISGRAAAFVRGLAGG